MPEKMARMADCLENGDFDNFRIDIHSCKSSLVNIGAMDMSEEARALEFATIAQNTSYIKNSFRGFADRIEELFSFISGIISEDAYDEKRARTMGSVEVLRNLLEDVRILMDNLEHDNAMELIDRTTSESYGQNLDRQLFQIRAAIDSFNYDKASDMIQSILGTEDI
jgi:HPt (histidine-containing phosphotransfer) domain-containing protein